MNCAQSGCEVTADSLMESGQVPAHCPTCGHPLRLVLTAGEVAEFMGLEVEAPNGHEAPEGSGDETPEDQR